MRILWVSNAPWAPSGYGVQTKLFAKRIASLGHEVALFNFYGHEGGLLNDQNLPMYPRAGHPYGQDIQGAHAIHFKADVMITLIDAWVMEPERYPPTVAWCPWFPVDHDPIPPPVLRKIQKAFAPIAYSRFGQRKAEERHIKALYVPHGVDTKAFCPMSKIEARKALGWPLDRFIVGMVAANNGLPCRKAYPQSFQAFSRFLQRMPTALMYVHCVGQRGERQGVNLHECAELFGIYPSIIWSDEYKGLLGYDDDYMRTVYSAMDVLLACSLGEGFGVPILEAQACGTPVITGEWSAMNEITFAGWKHPASKAWPTYTYQASFMFEPSPVVLDELLVEAAKHANDTALQTKARAGAMDYDADRVTELHWKPVLEEIERRLHGSKRLQTVVQGALE